MCALLAGLMLGPVPLHAGQTDEAVVQAAFILNFAKFTEWTAAGAPERTGSFQLCVQGGRDELLQSLRALDGRPVHGQSLVVRRVSRGDELRSCHVLVWSDGTLPGAASLSGVLLVSDQPGFAQAGGHIGLLHAGAKLRFEVNRTTASQAGLKLSSQLLGLAATVLDASAGGTER